MEKELVKIAELTKNEELIENVTTLLKENNIDYKIDLEENWTVPYKYAKYIPTFSIYVEKQNVEEAKKILNDYTDKNSVESGELLEEEPDDPTSKQAEKVKFVRKIGIASFFVFLAAIVVLVIVANNIQH